MAMSYTPCKDKGNQKELKKINQPWVKTLCMMEIDTTEPLISLGKWECFYFEVSPSKGLHSKGGSFVC